ncbi:DsrE family protein [Candidatus Micrarchaeota archaeon]|nr:DsrE family protein [Candidatus Micrarchaeota archaeon]
MKVCVIVSVNDAETVWNAFRFANFSLKQGDDVSVFLTGKGVEYESASTDQFDARQQAEEFTQNNGKIFACGTCVKARNQAETKTCPISNMRTLYELVKTSDKVVSY